VRSAAFARPILVLEEILAMSGNRGLDRAQIQRKLALLEKHAGKKKLPYANITARKWFRLNPPLLESNGCRFESEHRIRLPEDYWEFLLKVGNGGGGGIFPLGCDSEDYSYEQAIEMWPDGSYRLHLYGGMNLDRPFPTRAWLPGPFGDGEEDLRRTRDGRNDPQVAGSMRIYHCGCAIYNVLIITGKERGHVWCDSRSDGRSIFPERPVGGRGRLTFGRWYLGLLDRLLEWHGAEFGA
jgi:hypothetical protein